MWYMTLDKFVGTQASARVALTKVALDQLAFAPVFLAVFLSALEAFKNPSVAAVKAQLGKEYREILMVNWMIWPRRSTRQLLRWYLTTFVRI